MRRALLVGIDDYASAPLRGCVNDARAMQRLLCRHADGRVNFDAQVLTSDQVSVTRPVLRESIDRLFADPVDVALLYFSGHGTENDLGGYLVTSDATLYDEGVPLADVLDRANLAKHIGEVAIIVDSCHSGALGNVPEVDNAHASLGEGVSILTAGRATQPALERDEGGSSPRSWQARWAAAPPISSTTSRVPADGARSLLLDARRGRADMTRVGITGHRDLGPTTRALVREALTRALAAYRPVHGVSCPAEGADELFAEQRRRSSGPTVDGAVSVPRPA